MKKTNRFEKQPQNKIGKDDLILILEGIVIGALAGLTTIFYRFCILWSETGLFCILKFIQGNVLAITLWFLALIFMGVFVSRMIRLDSMAGGSGIPQVFCETSDDLDPCWWRIILIKFIGGSVSILGGLSLGRSGPSIQLGAMAAKGYTRARNFDRAKEIHFLSCGAGAGLAATFNAPLAGLMFIMEELRHTFDRSLLTAGLAATLSADFTSKLFFGTFSLFSFSTQAMPLHYYWLLIVLGIILGLAGAGYNAAILKTQALFQCFKKVPEELRISIVFIFSGVLSLFLPQVLAGGQRMIAMLQQEQPALTLIALLLAVKFIFSALSFASGAPGGIIFPLLVLGAYIGALAGSVATCFLPLSSELFPQFVILGIAGLFVGIMRTPLTGILLITELTGSLHSMLDVSIVCILAYAVANLTGSKPICTSLTQNMLKKSQK